MKLSHLTSAALAALTLAGLARAELGPKRIPVDSTGVSKTALQTMVFPAQPPGLTDRDVTMLIQARDFGAGAASNLPPGYREVQVPMGPRDLGAGGGTQGLSYYQGLGYATVSDRNTDYQTYPAGCEGNLTPRVLAFKPSCTFASDGSCILETSYYVCEPVGTRTTLEKVVSNDTLTVTAAMLAAKTIAPAVGLSTNTSTAVCQSLGYVNYVPASIVGAYQGSCSDRITRWNGSSLYNDSACYNDKLLSLQCFK